MHGHMSVKQRFQLTMHNELTSGRLGSRWAGPQQGGPWNSWAVPGSLCEGVHHGPHPVSATDHPLSPPSPWSPPRCGEQSQVLDLQHRVTLSDPWYSNLSMDWILYVRCGWFLLSRIKLRVHFPYNPSCHTSLWFNSIIQIRPKIHSHVFSSLLLLTLS